MEYWSTSDGVDDEFQKLVLRMNPPRVSVDNESDNKATLIKVDSANKRGSLLEVVQVLTHLNLIIQRAYISSDGEWFMDVFHVTDEYGKKVYEPNISDRIQQSLGPRGCSFRSFQCAEHTSIELSGRDRPGLLSEVFAVLTDLNCNIVAAQVWTHNSRMASVLFITDQSNGSAIDDPHRLANIKHLLLSVVKGDYSSGTVNSVAQDSTDYKDRRLHQIMYADRDYDHKAASNSNSLVNVTVDECVEKGYTVVNLRCPDRPKLLFDAVCTLTDMNYVVYHATILTKGPEAQQEYYIRHMDGCPVSSEAERQRLIHCLEAAIMRRASEGIRLELCSVDRVGLLSDVTRIFRENGLSVTRAEVATRGTQAVNLFYVTDASGHEVKRQTIEALRQQIGSTLLRVKDDTSPPQSTLTSSTFRSRSEKFLYNLGLIKSCS